jgi:hypothetical protein
MYLKKNTTNPTQIIRRTQRSGACLLDLGYRISAEELCGMTYFYSIAETVTGRVGNAEHRKRLILDGKHHLLTHTPPYH